MSASTTLHLGYIRTLHFALISLQLVSAVMFTLFDLPNILRRWLFKYMVFGFRPLAWPAASVGA